MEFVLLQLVMFRIKANFEKLTAMLHSKLLTLVGLLLKIIYNSN
jgi:hypothetical protein